MLAFTGRDCCSGAAWVCSEVCPALGSESLGSESLGLESLGSGSEMLGPGEPLVPLSAVGCGSAGAGAVVPEDGFRGGSSS